MTEEVYPVVSPELPQQRSLRKPGDLGRVDLIHDLSMDGLAASRVGACGFRRWAHPACQRRAASGSTTPPPSRRRLVRAGAWRLPRSVMARDDLAAGHPLRPLPKRRPVSGLACQVVFRPESAGQQRLLAFRDWLFREAGRPPPSRIGMNGVEFVQRRASRMKFGLSR